MKKISLLLLTIVGMTLTLKAQSSNNTETQKIVDQFFRTYREKGHEEAIGALLGTNKWIPEKSAENVSMKLTELLGQIGQFYGYEKIKESRYGVNVIQYTYLVRYERQPLRFLFRFYRPNDKWQTQGFEYEVEFLDELDETSKADKLKENYEH
jgi:hypothetical protein